MAEIVQIIRSSSSSVVHVLITVFFIGFSCLLIILYNVLVFKPGRLRSKLRSQGINGPPPSFLLGNLRELEKIQSSTQPAPSETSTYKENDGDHHNKKIVLNHNWGSTVFSVFEDWTKVYGSTFMFSLGNIPVLYVTDTNLFKEIRFCTSLNLGRPTSLQKQMGPLLGQGIVTSNGSFWAHQKKIIAPELYINKVKGMGKLMVDSAGSLVKTWETEIEEQAAAGSGRGLAAEIRIDEGLRNCAADIISRACFGSSYFKGEEIFQRIRTLQLLLSKQALVVLGIPGFRHLPTKNNREIWRLEREIRTLILKVVKERMESTSEIDLLQMILEEANNGELMPAMPDDFIVDNCKSIYLAGHETNAMSISWSLVLLAENLEWQERVRAEVLEVCSGHLLEVDMLPKMKLLNMVIQETLRLYPPAFVSREALQDMKFGQIHVPKGVHIWVPIVTLQQDPKIWGPDAHMFNPERFERGTAAACNLPHVYMPFGVGPRMCLGQDFALMEMKIVLALILSKFSFSISPNYQHSPMFNFVIEPKYGIDLLFKKL